MLDDQINTNLPDDQIKVTLNLFQNFKTGGLCVIIN